MPGILWMCRDRKPRSIQSILSVQSIPPILLQRIALRNTFLVALGGALGAAARFLLGEAMAPLARTFPVHTLAINVLGSFVLGLVIATTPATGAARLLVGVGVCGGFTTFSTYSAEVVALSEQGQLARAAGYAAASVGLGIGAMVLGLAAGRLVAGRWS